MSYSFAQDCKEQVAVLQRLKASKSAFTTTAPSHAGAPGAASSSTDAEGNSEHQQSKQQRRVVLVLGMGATTALGDMSNVACLRNLLPAAISSLSLRYDLKHLLEFTFVSWLCLN
jgi:hypothetical protein